MHTLCCIAHTSVHTLCYVAHWSVYTLCCIAHTVLKSTIVCAHTVLNSTLVCAHTVLCNTLICAHTVLCSTSYLVFDVVSFPFIKIRVVVVQGVGHLDVRQSQFSAGGKHQGAPSPGLVQPENNKKQQMSGAVWKQQMSGAVWKQQKQRCKTALESHVYRPIQVTMTSILHYIMTRTKFIFCEQWGLLWWVRNTR